MRDHALQPAFDDAVQLAEAARAGYADAVFRPGEHTASELRFTRRPPEHLLDALRRGYPKDLRIEWGEQIAGEEARTRLAGTIAGIVRRVPGTANLSAGFDADGRVSVEFDGSADPTAVAEAVRTDPAFQELLVDGRPPTEVRVTRVRAGSLAVTW